MSYKFSKIVLIKNKEYTIKAPSTNPDKKYDVFLDDKKLLSFGDRNYQQYKDKLGYYSKLNHLDPKRKKLYRFRHQFDKGVVQNNPNYPGFFSWHLLW